ncbi:MAG: hypothetical protein LCH54_12145 [Bacteroidetes bacterium]|nr:hypothetical protein [Bacteroidota bacterium]
MRALKEVTTGSTKANENCQNQDFRDLGIFRMGIIIYLVVLYSGKEFHYNGDW